MKNLKRSFLLLSIILCGNVALFSQTETKDLIDIQCEACLDSIENQSTQGMVECERKALAAWDKELNKYYNLLMGISDKSEKAKFKTAQKNWLTYKKSERDFYETAYYNEQGTIYQLFAAGRETELTKTRVVELKSYYDVLTYD